MADPEKHAEALRERAAAALGVKRYDEALSAAAQAIDYFVLM